MQKIIIFPSTKQTMTVEKQGPANLALALQ